MEQVMFAILETLLFKKTEDLSLRPIVLGHPKVRRLVLHGVPTSAEEQFFRKVALAPQKIMYVDIMMNTRIQLIRDNPRL